MTKEERGKGSPPNNRRVLRDRELGCELTNKVHNSISLTTLLNVGVGGE